MMQYQVVIKSSPSELETAVNKLLEEGWRPQGGVCLLDKPYRFEHHNYDLNNGYLYVERRHLEFAQALVKD